MILQLDNVSFSYGKREILRNVCASLETGKVVFLLGENGSGKTTLLKLLARLCAPQSGRIELDGRAITSISRRAYARQIAVATQQTRPALDLTVGEFCLIGRNAKLPRFAGASARDFQAVQSALEKVDLADAQKLPAQTLSGGEFQRLALAAALALEGNFLLLDEPVSAQDPPRAQKLLAMVQAERPHCGILVIAHDLELASAFADEIWLLADHELFAQGTPQEVLTAENISRLYHCQAAEVAKTTFQLR